MTAKRLLDCSASDLATMSKNELLYAIRASERRAIARLARSVNR